MEQTTKRNAGILLAISSLPSSFGIGDFGPEARKFADFLRSANQSYWQLLPLNPTLKGSGYSPYSSISSMAGNTLLISPELLVAAGLLDNEDMQQSRISCESSCNYDQAEDLKNKIFDKAYNNFLQQTNHALQKEFDEFCRQQKIWL